MSQSVVLSADGYGDGVMEEKDVADLSPRLVVVLAFVVGKVLSWCRQPLDRAKPVSSPYEGADRCST